MVMRTIDIILASEIIFMLQYTTMFCELLLYAYFQFIFYEDVLYGHEENYTEL